MRASYYTDMSEYIRQNYAAFLDVHPNASYNERMIYFMNLELKFAEYAGYEIT